MVDEGCLLGGLVEIGILGIAGRVLLRQPANTSPLTTPTPTATKNSRSMPATYTPYLDRAESPLSQSVMTQKGR